MDLHDGDEHRHRHEHKHEHKHRAKFTDDTPAEAAEKREISSRVGRGVLTDEEALYGAPTAPSGTYVGEVFDAAGEVVRFIGAKVPLYITPEILDFEFVEYIKDHKDAMAEALSKGKSLSNEDKIIIMAGTKAGRKKLGEYKDPAEIFATDSGAKPMLVKDYYLEENGLMGVARGVRPSLKTKIGEKLSLTNQTLVGALGKAIKG